MPQITMKELLESGVHFGHQTRRWNPKMREYIFGERNGIHIIDLQKTLKLFKEALRYVGEAAEQGKNILFVGTKRQAQEAIAEEAHRCHMYYVNNRWLGGLLTNWTTVQKSIVRLKELDRMATEEDYEGRSKKEISRLERERKHLHQNLAGIKDMPALPDVMFVIDSSKEEIAVREAPQAQHPGDRGGGHQLRSGHGRLRDSRQRRCAARDPAVRQQGLRRRHRRPADGQRARVRSSPAEGVEGESLIMTEDGTSVTAKGVRRTPTAPAADPQSRYGRVSAWTLAGRAPECRPACIPLSVPIV